ncbi:MAG TPA: response regulator [Chloroflexi bacterium]|nr:response regulator [Chloroflexota bacterium]
MIKKILIVDDQAYIRVLLEQTLEDLRNTGIELLSAGDGLEAWKTVQEQRPDLVILDIMMPGLSGYEVCKRIKTDPDLSKVHIIMLTAKGQDEDLKRSIEAGADEYVTKPFNPDYLIERAASLLDVK